MTLSNRRNQWSRSGDSDVGSWKDEGKGRDAGKVRSFESAA
jgi:hypothetical protein